MRTIELYFLDPFSEEVTDDYVVLGLKLRYLVL